MFKILALIITLTLIGVSSGHGGTRTYDIELLLNERHPFSKDPSTPDVVSTLGIAVPIRNIRPPARIPSIRPGSLVISRPASQSSLSDRMPKTSGLRRGQESKFENSRLISELRIGLLVHDVGPFSRNEEDGLDGNLEILFASPLQLKKIGSPRPHLGFSLNSAGDTSQAYLGITWEWRLWRDWFVDFSLGGAMHDGKKTTSRIDRKELGCKVLFRESVEFGYVFNERHSVSAFLDHISNAKLCVANEGLESYGIRYGYRF